MFNAKRPSPRALKIVAAIIATVVIVMMYIEHNRLFKSVVPPGLNHRIFPQDLPHCKDDPRAQYSLLIKLFIEPIDRTSTYMSVRKLVYLPSLIELTHPRRFFIDAGARAFMSSTGGWFLPTYTATNPAAHDFQIIGFEPDPNFHHEWRGRAGVEFWPYAVSDKNGTANFGEKFLTILDRTEGAPRAPGQRELNVTTIDFSDFVRRRIRKEDFLVLKMDIEGPEWLVLPKMIEEGTIYLIDELFLECHGGYLGKTRADCIELIYNLRKLGIYAHEWT